MSRLTITFDGDLYQALKETAAAKRLSFLSFMTKIRNKKKKKQEILRE